MQITIKKRLLNSMLEVDVDEKDEKDALRKALFFTQPDVCGLCGKTNIVWQANEAKSEKDGRNYTFIRRRCQDCKATSTAGEYLDGGLFWKQWEIYQAPSQDPGRDDKGFEESTKDDYPERDEESIPF